MTMFACCKLQQHFLIMALSCFAKSAISALDSGGVVITRDSGVMTDRLEKDRGLV
jgi:hypothetical protein